MTKREQLEFFNRRIAKAQPGIHLDGGLLYIQTFSCKMPQDWTNEIMHQLIPGVCTTKDAGPIHDRMQSHRCAPRSRDCFQPTHSQEKRELDKHVIEAAVESAWVHRRQGVTDRGKGDTQLPVKGSRHILYHMLFFQCMQSSRLERLELPWVLH